MSTPREPESTPDQSEEVAVPDLPPPPPAAVPAVPESSTPATPATPVQPAEPGVPVIPGNASRYPGALDERLLTPRAPLTPGMDMYVLPGVMGVGGKTSPAQWAEDPTGAHQLRWWNGAIWTDHVADDGVASVDPMPER